MFSQAPGLLVKFPTFRHPAPGYLLISPNSTEQITIVDHSGESVYPVPASNSNNLVTTDSTLTYFDDGLRAFVRLNSHFVAIDTMTLSGAYDVDFHECHILPNGNYVILGTENRIMNLSGVVPGGSSLARVVGAVIQERTFSGVTVFEWKSLDHIPVTDATEDIDLTQTTVDYIHVNSVELEPDGNFLVSCRHTDEVVKVSRANGSLMWRLGGQKSKHNQFTFIDDTIDNFTGFSHQHNAARTIAGNIILFDNGTLKPTAYSRVAEYQVNEVSKTAKLVWSYRPSPDIVVKNMGSVQELSNKNVLIGYGSGASSILGQEVSRDGIVQLEIAATGQDPYKLRKAVFAMSGVERLVSNTGTTTFSHGDSSVHFSTTLTRVDGPTSIIAERHSYAPHNMTFADEPCVPMNMRWVVRASPLANIAGSIRFHLGSFGFAMPSLLQLYHRPVEGIDAFTEVAALFDANTNSLVAASFVPGEYLVAYPMCYDPAPSAPNNNETNVSNNVVLVWTPAVQSNGYDVEIFKGPNTLGPPTVAFRTLRTDTTFVVPEAGSQYTWRTRAVRPAPHGAGAWSQSFSFRTRLGAPIALAPSSLPDSVPIPQNATFRWTRVKSAARYRVRVVPFGTSTPALDTLVIDTTFRASGSLPGNSSMVWSVRGEIDTNGGDWSNTLFIMTAPNPPRLLLPAPDALGVDPETASNTWTTVDGAKSYHIRVYKNVDNGPIWFEDTVTSTQIDLEGMSSNTTYHWQVRTIGRYGAGPWSNSQWFMTRGQSVLGIASLLAPVGTTGVDTLQAMLAWSGVSEATHYHVQLSSKPTFSKPDVEWQSLAATSHECPPLDAGKVYRWRVMALNDIASGPWSSTATFTTMPGPDDALEPLTPVPGCLDVPLRGTVTFIADPRFDEYQVEYSVTPLFTIVDQISTVTGSVAPYDLAPEQQYWWHVIGFKNGVALDTGNAGNFTTAKDTVTSVREPATGVTSHPVIFRLVGTTLVVEGAESEGAALQIIDITGRSVYNLPQLREPHADVSHLPIGVYVVVVRLANDSVIAYRFVRTH